MKEESRRQKRIGSLLQEALSRILIQELQGVTTGLVTVTRVDVLPDLKTGRACHGGTYKYDLPKNGEPGAWTTYIKKPAMCQSGYHVTVAD
jgi:hypothetical protein